MRVNLTMFKENGKWYTDGHYTTKKKHLFEIWEEVRQLQESGTLPGLREGAKEFTILVDVPMHPHRHPHLILGPTLQAFWSEHVRDK